MAPPLMFVMEVIARSGVGSHVDHSAGAVAIEEPGLRPPPLDHSAGAVAIEEPGCAPSSVSGCVILASGDAAASWAARSLLGMTEISRRAGWSAGFQNACGVGCIYRKQTRERIRGGIRPTARDMKTSVRPAQIAPRSACTQPVLRAVFSKVDTLAVFMAWFLPAPRQGVYRRRRACARPYGTETSPPSCKDANRAHARLRSRANAPAQLKTSHILRKLHCCL
jgi:hypothetical protein